MKFQGVHVRWRDLMASWRARGEMFFYARLLDDSRKIFIPARAQKTVVATVKTERKGKVRVGLQALGSLFALVVRCALAPKARTVICNHSQRRRISPQGPRPLYLSGDIFSLKSKVIIEDQEVDFSYAGNPVVLCSHALRMCTALVVRTIELLSRRRFNQDESDFVSFMVRLRIWKILLRLLAPARMLLLVWYGKESMIAACRELGIEVIDMQHGIIYGTHPFYNLREANAVAGSHYLLPDKCFVYGEYWRQNLLASGWPAQRVEVAGYFPDKGPGCDVPLKEPYIFYSSQPHSNDILVAHIWSILPETIARGWKIVIALHPSEDASGYAHVLSDHVLILQQDSYDLMRGCAVHISYSSTLLWEAMLFDKSSYVLDFGREATDLLGDLLRFGYGRPLVAGEFPEPFALPSHPPVSHFFAEPRKDLLDA